MYNAHIRVKTIPNLDNKGLIDSRVRVVYLNVMARFGLDFDAGLVLNIVLDMGLVILRAFRYEAIF